MDLKIISGKHGDLTFTRFFPGKVALLLLPGAKYIVATTPGNDSFFLFQEFSEAGIKVRFYHFYSRIRDSLLLLAEPMTTLRVALSHTHQSYLPQLGRQQFVERNFNFLHIPHFSMEFNIGPDETYSFADIIFPDGYLEHYADEFLFLQNFLKSAARHAPAKLCLHNQVATLEMMRWMDACSEGWQIGKVVAQLVRTSLEALQRRMVNRTVRMKPAEMQQIYQVADLLRQSKEELSLQEISERFDISIYKLNKGFRQIYGHSVLHHRMEEKMRLALRLIYDKRYPIKQVASILDYWPQNFIRAFKHRFGYTPGRNACHQLISDEHPG